MSKGIITSKSNRSQSFFSKNIKILRLRTGLSQDEIASKIGVSGATWSDYERGKTEPKFSTLVSISHYFIISIDTLIKDKISDANLIHQDSSDVEFHVSGQKKIDKSGTELDKNTSLQPVKVE